MSSRPTLTEWLPLISQFTLSEVHGLEMLTGLAKPSMMNATYPFVTLEGTPQSVNVTVCPTEDGLGVDVKDDGFQIVTVSVLELAAPTFVSPL
jgi:hypothetical protein